MTLNTETTITTCLLSHDYTGLPPVPPLVRALLPGWWFWDGIRTREHLDSFLPLLPPSISQEVVVLWGYVVGVRQLHGTDQVFSEHLQETGQHLSRHSNPLKTSAAVFQFASCTFILHISLACCTFPSPQHNWFLTFVKASSTSSPSTQQTSSRDKNLLQLVF